MTTTNRVMMDIPECESPSDDEYVTPEWLQERNVRQELERCNREIQTNCNPFKTSEIMPRTSTLS